ncbi:MAG: hypothetical protein RIR70_1218 [Pseudomonadota bacterium]
MFTPPAIVERMIALRQRFGSVLDPACGDGAFSSRIPGCVALEIDARFAPDEALVMDFFDYPEREKFDTIIGNPPYVRFQDIADDTRARLDLARFDARSNLYLFFIEKALRHLKPGGELIFITPRDFLKATSAAGLNKLLFEQGTLTDLIDLGDSSVFSGVTPNCIIWRFEKGNTSHLTRDGRIARLAGGQLIFTRNEYTVPAAEVFYVKVGAVSGADDVFANEHLGNLDFVCSTTRKTGQTRRMIFNQWLPELDAHKLRLIQRGIRRFDDSNWWQWGRQHHLSERPRVYVNSKTRHTEPFFVHDSIHYDGSVLALFPRNAAADVTALAHALNAVDWAELGFVCDGRYLFSQRSLEETLLPAHFSRFLPSAS